MRLGDAGDYECFESPYEAGYSLGYALLVLNIKSYKEIEDKIYRIESGIVIEGIFDGYNYISLYIGDEEGEYIDELTEEEYDNFLFGVKEGIER
jgi:hypothetical protein